MWDIMISSSGSTVNYPWTPPRPGDDSDLGRPLKIAGFAFASAPGMHEDAFFVTTGVEDSRVLWTVGTRDPLDLAEHVLRPMVRTVVDRRTLVLHGLDGRIFAPEGCDFYIPPGSYHGSGGVLYVMAASRAGEAKLPHTVEGVYVADSAQHRVLAVTIVGEGAVTAIAIFTGEGRDELNRPLDVRRSASLARSKIPFYQILSFTLISQSDFTNSPIQTWPVTYYVGFVSIKYHESYSLVARRLHRGHGQPPRAAPGGFRCGYFAGRFRRSRQQHRHRGYRGRQERHRRVRARGAQQPRRGGGARKVPLRAGRRE